MSSNSTTARDVSIDYLRTTLTLMVVGHHSMLAYTTFARFDAEHYLASTHPIVDAGGWLLFDYAQYFNDVFFMSLMFFVSGLFAWPSLQRHGVGGFLRERFLRLGLPFAVAVTTLMPIAYYASWEMTGRATGFVDYVKNGFFSDDWLPGPLWFIWVLLMFDCIAATLHAAGLQLKNLDAFHRVSERRPWLIGVGVLLVSGVLYLTALANFGDRWVALGTRPFYFQLPRIGLYFTWFAFGVVVGTAGLKSGLLSATGALAKHWRGWIALCFIIFNVLVFTPRLLAAAELLTNDELTAIQAVLWVISCTVSCIGFLALFRGAVHTRRVWMDSLTRCAYAIYIVHWVFVIWMQKALLGVGLHPGIKGTVVFLVAILASWAVARALLAIPVVRKYL